MRKTDINETWETDNWPTDEELDEFTKAVLSISDDDDGGSGSSSSVCLEMD